MFLDAALWTCLALHCPSLPMDLLITVHNCILKTGFKRHEAVIVVSDDSTKSLELNELLEPVSGTIADYSSTERQLCVEDPRCILLN